MASSGEKSAEHCNGDVFVNCPFDDEYRPCFEALLFAIAISGYRVRCALEENDSGDIRFDKLCRLISSSDDSIHDLSRTGLGVHGYPRFNMPFELGLVMGARRFGDGRHRRKRACIMVSREHVMPRFLSDLAGNDARVHGDDPNEIIRVVRSHLHKSPEGTTLPGAAHIIALFEQFKRDLPFLAERARLTMPEIHPRLAYRNFMDVLEAFCSAAPLMAASMSRRR